MNDPNELTPKEKYFVSLFKQPDALFRRSLIRKLGLLTLSLGFMAGWFVDHDVFCVLVGYAMLVSLLIRGLFQSKRGIHTIHGIITKYEAQLEAARRGQNY